MLVIDINPIRQKQILLHPSFQLVSSTSDIDSALKDAILLQDSAIKQHHHQEHYCYYCVPHRLPLSDLEQFPHKTCSFDADIINKENGFDANSYTVSPSLRESLHFGSIFILIVSIGLCK